MKTIGLIGGMSWESTVTYYQVINEAIVKGLGGFHSAKIMMYSVDFAEFEACLETNDWDKLAQMLSEAAKKLEAAGADFVLICTNTMHKLAPKVQAAISVPLLHIAEATADALREKGITKVGLLGTRFTMTQDFFTEKLTAAGIEAVVPDEEDIAEIDRVIFGELCLGKILPESKKYYLDVIDRLRARGAQGVILGCTEIGLLIAQQDTDLPVFDTTLIHAAKAAALALEK